MSFDIEQKTTFLQRLIAGSLLMVLVVGAVYLLYLQPVFKMIDSRETLSNLALNIESLSKKIEGRSRIQEYVASASAKIEKNDAFLHSKTYSLAVSSLQVVVSDLANRYGLVVRRMQGIPIQMKDVDNGDVRLRLKAIAKNARIVQFLRAIAAQKLLISVNHLELSVVRVARAGDERSYVEDIDIDVTVELSAFWRVKRDI